MRPIQRIISVGFATAAIAAAMLPAVSGEAHESPALTAYGAAPPDEARPVLVSLLAAWDSASEGDSARP